MVLYNAYRRAPSQAPRSVAIVPPPRQARNHRKREDQIGLKLYLWIFDRAKAGEPAPTNREIMTRFDMGSTSTAAREIGILESTGLIEVERHHRSRRVFVRESQRWTA